MNKALLVILLSLMLTTFFLFIVFESTKQEVVLDSFNNLLKE